MPIDPYSQGIGTFLNVYGTMNPNSNVAGTYGNNYGQNT